MEEKGVEERRWGSAGGSKEEKEKKEKKVEKEKEQEQEKEQVKRPRCRCGCEGCSEREGRAGREGSSTREVWRGTSLEERGHERGIDVREKRGSVGGRIDSALCVDNHMSATTRETTGEGRGKGEGGIRPIRAKGSPEASYRAMPSGNFRCHLASF